MFAIKKRPQVIRNLIDLASYITQDNLDVSDRFLTAAEAIIDEIYSSLTVSDAYGWLRLHNSSL